MGYDKALKASEFQDKGYLQEVNRQFFHPLGLALALVGEVGGIESDAIQIIVIDSREDAEGFYFDEELLDPQKAREVAWQHVNRREAREKALGYWIQPVEGVTNKVGETSEEE